MANAFEKDTYDLEKIRVQKHNCGERFGLVVNRPIKALFNELLNNPSVFSIEEQKRILDLYNCSREINGLYTYLGWSIEEQLDCVQNKLIPLIQEKLAELYNDFLQPREFHDKSIAKDLQRALGHKDALCDLLNDIGSKDYGPTESFNLAEVVVNVFEEENESIFLEGSKRPFTIIKDVQDCSDIHVCMNIQNFRSCVLYNIITNLHAHAFHRMDILYEYISVNSNFLAKFFKWELKMLKKAEKKIRISLKQDPNRDDRINLIIENNGQSFLGDPKKVFEKGEGKNSGLGLFSAKDFLEKNDATIEMLPLPSPKDEYKVKFKINLPIVKS